jgi:NAD dependent epimerase/dehydratase
MKILITGAAGFVGSHLTERCLELGHQVRAFTHYNSKNQWGWLENNSVVKKYAQQLEVIAGDVRDYDSVFDASKDVDAIFHLAALIGIPYSYVSPLAYVKTNVEGTYNTLQAARSHGTKNILVTSTSETYGTAQYVPMDEKHPMVGQSPYSASKIGADNLAVSYARSFNTPVKIVRPFNVYGPRQSARAIIPSIIIQILAGKRELKLGNTSPTRDLTFVKDTVNGFLEIAEASNLNGEYCNIGMNEEVSVQTLVDTIAKLMNVKITVTTDPTRVRPGASEVERLYCDASKIKAHTKWKPQYNLEQGLKETIAFLTANQGLYKDIYNV